VVPGVRTFLACDFLTRWPSLAALRGVRRSTLMQFFRAHNSVRRETLEARVRAISESMPLVTDGAFIASSVLMIRALAAQMKATVAAIRQFDKKIERLCAEHEDYELFASLPGAGSVYASRLLVALGGERGRWESADEVVRLSGIAPVMERSGESCRVRWRYLCPKFLRQSFHEYAGESVRHSSRARAFYESQIAKGKGHQAAVRALAYKWIRIIYRCWQTRTRYDEVQYLESLRREGSPLLTYAAENRWGRRSSSRASSVSPPNDQFSIASFYLKVIPATQPLIIVIPFRFAGTEGSYQRLNSPKITPAWRRSRPAGSYPPPN
jgi:Transposase IS116/IS110/IS902 family